MAGNDTEEMIIANGIDGTTGNYLLPPSTLEQTVLLATSELLQNEQLGVLNGFSQQMNQPNLGASFEVDLTRTQEAGWGIVYHTDEDEAVKAALQPLVDHRLKCIANDKLVKVLEYKQGETVIQWLARHKVGVGDINPEKIPFYLLLIGSPTKIPFLFGHVLDAIYGVGRLYFDRLDRYKAYVESVISYETATSIPNSNSVCFFGPQHVGDGPTRLSAHSLVRPLAGVDRGEIGVVERLARTKYNLRYESRYYTPEQSTKEILNSLFCPSKGDAIPTLLFTASHGVGWPLGDEHQIPAQGALLCQDFPGIGFGPVKPEHYFSAADLTSDATVFGMVSFHFACYGVGTPKTDRFLHKQGVLPPQIAPDSFFSALPQSLLGHPNGSALGVIGHVERAWPSSIKTIHADSQLLPFENALSYILIGLPLGFALKDFNERYSGYSISLAALLEKKGFGVNIPDSDLASIWTSRNDAEAYVLFGDPGVVLRKDLLQRPSDFSSLRKDL